MIKFLLRIKEAFVKLSWIKTLIDAGVISSAAGRALEDAVFTVYFGIATYIYEGLNTGVRGNPKLVFVALAVGFGKAILTAILKSMRDYSITKNPQ